MLTHVVLIPLTVTKSCERFCAAARLLLQPVSGRKVLHYQTAHTHTRLHACAKTSNEHAPHRAWLGPSALPLSARRFVSLDSYHWILDLPRHVFQFQDRLSLERSLETHIVINPFFVRFPRLTGMRPELVGSFPRKPGQNRILWLSGGFEWIAGVHEGELE